MRQISKDLHCFHYSLSYIYKLNTMQFAWNNIWMLWFKDHYRFCYRHFISMCHDNNM